MSENQLSLIEELGKHGHTNLTSGSHTWAVRPVNALRKPHLSLDMAYRLNDNSIEVSFGSHKIGTEDSRRISPALGSHYIDILDSKSFRRRVAENYRIVKGTNKYSKIRTTDSENYYGVSFEINKSSGSYENRVYALSNLAKAIYLTLGEHELYEIQEMFSIES